jgi:hypothetical protein
MDGVGGALLEVDVAALSYDQQLDHLLALEQLAAQVTAASVRTLAALETGGVPGQSPSLAGKQLVREEVACLLTISPWMAAARLHDAAYLVQNLPATVAQLETGQTSYWHARALLDTVHGLPADVTAQILERVQDKATTQTVTEFRQTLKRTLARVDPQTFEARHKKAAAKRGVWLRPAQDGMAWINACTSATDATALFTSLTNLAAKPSPVPLGSEPDPRSADNRRIDALVDLVLAAELAAEASGQHLPAKQGRRPGVQVSVALSTLAGLDFQPGELLGYGPIPASLALQIAFDPTGTWRRLITDDTGRALDFPMTSYRPPTDLRDYILARDRTCRFPGCNCLSRNCDIDHHHDHAHGGTTSADNLGPLCARTHQVKHDAGWHVHRTPNGTTHWKSPTGRRYQKPPDLHPTDHTLPTAPDPPPF